MRQTGVAPAAAVVNSVTDEPGSATFRALAWSQDDDTDNEPVPYTGEDPYATDVTTARPPVEYVPPTGPIAEESRPWHRLPQLVFGLGAVVALIAVGGVAIALTGVANTTTPHRPAPHRHVGGTDQCRTAARVPAARVRRRRPRRHGDRPVAATASAAAARPRWRP